jgi:hypothetical protein
MLPIFSSDKDLQIMSFESRGMLDVALKDLQDKALAKTTPANINNL